MAKKPAAAPAGPNATDSDVYLMPWERPSADVAVEDSTEVPTPDAEHEEADEPTGEMPESDEIDAEDEDAEIEAELDEEEDADEAAAPEKPAAVVEFDIDGEKVTLEELKKRGLREADYTRKTQEAAEIRRDAEAKRDLYASQLAQLEAALKEALPKEPDWDKLRAEDPVEFAAAWADHERSQKQLQKVQAERQRVWEEQQEEWQKQQSETLAAGRKKLLALKPEWNDPAKLEADARTLQVYAETTYGWTPNVLESITDPNFVLLLDKAHKYDEMQTKGKANIAEKVAVAPSLKPGGRTAPTSQRPKQKEIEALRRRAKRGDESAVLALIEKSLD